MKKIMILGASILQLPAIIKAKEMGLEVIAVDMNEHAIGFRHADKSLIISTVDIPAVLASAKENKIDGIMTLASDMPMRTVAVVCKELGLVGVDEDTALKATDKAVMRQCLKEHHVPVPKFFCVREYDEYKNAVLNFNSKFMVKPADNSGSRGISLVNDIYNSDTVRQAYERSKAFSRNGNLVVEEYMSGCEVSVETLSVNGKCNVIQITDKLTTGAPYFVEMGHSQPTQHSRRSVEQIISVVNKAVQAVGIKSGPSHTEIIITNDGPKIVELGARLGGDNITTHLVPLSTGVDMVRCCIQIALGEQPCFDQKWEKGAAIRYFDCPPGKIVAIDGVEAAQKKDGVKQISFVNAIDDTVGEVRCSSDRIGFVIAQADTATDAIGRCDDVRKSVKIQVSEQV